MMQTNTAELFETGDSQAVKLPAEFRFEDTTQVYIRRDASTGDLILSPCSTGDWEAFMRLRQQLAPLAQHRPPEREQRSEQRDPFSGWQE